MENHKTVGFGDCITYHWEKHDPKIRKTYLKKIKVECCNCKSIHEYPIRVQGITGVRFFASNAVDCGHHCKTCGMSIEPIQYVPDTEEVQVKRMEQEARKLKKNLVKERLLVMTRKPCVKLHPDRHYPNEGMYRELGLVSRK